MPKCSGRNGRLVYALCVLLMGLSGAPVLHGQATGNISGIVTDSSGAAVPGADISVKNTETGQARAFVADDQGRYRAVEMALGNYEVAASKAGFSSESRRGITLTVGAQLVIDFQLQVGQQTQTVTVEGLASQVETQSTAVGVTVETKQLVDLPLNGRNYTQLIALNPGVVQLPPGTIGAGNQFYGNGQKYAISGSRAAGQNYLLDGTDMTDFWNNGPGSAGLGTALGVEAIAEFQALTNTYGAQYGGAGAVINASSRSGTNAFHGSAYEFLRNDVLESRNFFDVQKPPFRQNQFGASLGGPVKVNKAFFFFNYEGLRSRKKITNSVVVPDANAHNYRLPNAAGVEIPVTQNADPNVRLAIANTLALFPLPSTNILTAAGLPTGTGYAPITAFANGNEDYLLGRFDYTISDKSALFVRYVLDHADYNHSGGDSQPYTYWTEVETTRSHYATIEERQIFSPKLVNLARIDFTHPAETGDPVGSPTVSNGVAAPGTCQIDGACSSGVHPLQFVPGRADGVVTVGNGVNQLGPAGALPFYLIETRFGFADDIVWTAGAHSIKAGVVATRFRDNTWAPQRQLTWAFGTLSNFLQGLPQQLTGYLSPQQNPALDAHKDYRYWTFGFYGEDQWKVTSKLTLNLGLRYEPTTRIGEVNHALYTLINPPFGSWVRVDNATGPNPSLHNFDPRIGAAWDPFADHKTSFRAGFGIFHSVVFARDTVNWFQPPFIAVAQSATQGLTYPIPFSNYPVGTGLVIPTNGSLSVNVGTPYNTSKTPYQMQWNFNIQRELFPNTVLSLGYVGSHGVHLFIQGDVNSPTPVIGPSGRPTFGVLTNGSVIANPRINPAYSSLNFETQLGDAHYEGLQTSVTRRFSRGFQTQVSYTFSKSIDNGSGGFGLDGGQNVGNVFALGNERGLSNFNRTHNFRASGIYAFPFHHAGALGKVIEGWQITSIYSYLSGSPTTPASAQFTVHNSNGSNTGRPDLVAGCQLYPAQQTISNWFNPGCFQLQPTGTYGNAGRNIIIGPNLWNLDTSVIKDTRVTERFTLEFRAEAFNVLNHPSFQNPSATIFTNVAGARVGSAGQISATTSQPRQVQMSLKLLF